jgi:hypothetical protein
MLAGVGNYLGLFYLLNIAKYGVFSRQNRKGVICMLEGGEGINFFYLEKERHDPDPEQVPECGRCDGDGYLEYVDEDAGIFYPVICPDCSYEDEY